MHPNRYLPTLVLIALFCAQLYSQYGAEIYTEREGSISCKTVIWLGLHGDENCIESYQVTITLDDVDEPVRIFERGLHKIEYNNRPGTYQISVDDGLGCEWSYEKEVECNCDQLHYGVINPSCHENNGSITFTDIPIGAVAEMRWISFPPEVNWPNDPEWDKDNDGVHDLTTQLSWGNAARGDYTAQFNVVNLETDVIICTFQQVVSITDCTCELDIYRSRVSITNSTTCNQNS